MMKRYNEIKNDWEAAAFIERFNGLHDSMIVTLREKRPIGRGNCQNAFDRKLRVRFQVVSMKEEPVVELRFTGVYRYTYDTDGLDHHSPTVIRLTNSGWYVETDLLTVHADKIEWRLVSREEE